MAIIKRRPRHIYFTIDPFVVSDIFLSFLLLFPFIVFLLFYLFLFFYIVQQRRLHLHRVGNRAYRFSNEPHAFRPLSANLRDIIEISRRKGATWSPRRNDAVKSHEGKRSRVRELQKQSTRQFSFKFRALMSDHWWEVSARSFRINQNECYYCLCLPLARAWSRQKFVLFFS